MNQLSEEQQAAVASDQPVILVSAAPGSGKTTTTIARIRHLVARGVPAAKLCAVTFTTNAAKVLQERLNCRDCDGRGWYSSHGSPPEQIQCEHCLGAGSVRPGFCGTLHALALRLLQKHGGLVGLPDAIAVLDEEDAAALLESCRAKLKVKATADELQEACKEIRTQPLMNHPSKVQLVAMEFYSQQKADGTLDFDEIIRYATMLIQRNPDVADFDCVLIDEVQDTSVADMELYRSMVAVPLWFYVGDSDQNLFQFRGTTVRNMLELAAKPGTQVLPLSINYRCATSIVTASQRLIAHNPDRLPMTVRPRQDAPAGSVQVHAFDVPGAELVAIHHWLTGLPPGATEAVLWRTNALADQCRTYLQDLGVKLATTDRAKADRPEARLGKAVIALLANPWSEPVAMRYVAFLQGKDFATKFKAQADADLTTVAAKLFPSLLTTFNPSTCGLTPEHLESITLEMCGGQSAVKDWIMALARTVPSPFTLVDLLLAAARPDEDQPAGEGVFVGTAHSAKGCEWDNCWIGGVEVELWPGRDTASEARRLLYVAMTRAKETLCLSWCRTRPASWAAWKTEQRNPSAFLKELQP